jgi:hypothetical protein
LLSRVDRDRPSGCKANHGAERRSGYVTFSPGDTDAGGMTL